MKIQNLLLTAVTLSALAVSGAGHAQTTPAFPSKTVTLVIPFTPGSGSDLIARIIAPRLSARWGQPVIVDNKPGASGNLGHNFVAKAAPDGHILMLTADSFTMAPAIYKNMPYDPANDFAPVVTLADASYAFAVNPSVPAKDLKSLVSHIKANPGKVNYGTPGNGTPHHLAMEVFKAKAGVDILHVPYKGIAGALTDLMGGQVQLMYGSANSLVPHANSGKVRLLAITGSTRSPLVPDVATFQEQGMDAMDAGNAYYFVSAPARTPPELIARLNGDIAAVVNASEVKSELLKQGLTVRTGTPAQLGVALKSDLVRWRKVVTDAGITAD
jgi:tripartite-type tricarboxylate transporter receptor subunit TctC